DKAVDLRECRRLTLAQIGPEDAALLHYRIGALLDVLAEVGIGRFCRGFQAIAVHVEQPAVERAAQAAVLQPPEGKVCAAVRAIAIDETVAALLVTEEHEVFTQQPHRPDRPW